MGTVEEYRKRRSERLAKRGVVVAERDSRFPAGLLREHGIKPLISWTYRDAWEALKEVGVTPSDVYQQLRQRDAVHMDADEGEEENESGGSGHQYAHGHGNTKLPFGLCQREGIEIDTAWTPKDAWAALEGRGYSAAEAYRELEETGHVSPKSPKATEEKKTEGKKTAGRTKVDLSEVERIVQERDQRRKDVDSLQAERQKAREAVTAAGIDFKHHARLCAKYQDMLDEHERQFDLEDLYVTQPSMYRAQREKRDKIAQALKDSTQKANEAMKRQDEAKRQVSEVEEKIRQAENNGPTADDYRQAVQAMIEQAPFSAEVQEYRGREQEARVLKGRKANIDSALSTLTKQQGSIAESLEQRKAALQSEDLSEYLRSWYEKDLTRLEKYDSDYRGQIEQLQKQKSECEAKLAQCERATGSPKSALSGQDAKEWQKTYDLIEKYGAEPEGSYTELSDVVNEARSSKVEYNGVRRYVTTPTGDDIIGYVGGGDQTKGSCASLGFAYLANRAGFEVLDFRGGSSQEVVSRKCEELIRKLGAREEKHTNDLKAANALLSEVQEGKEFYFVTGRHASVVRKQGGKLQYLELQHPLQNGWKDFTAETLPKRFACKKSHTVSGMKYEASSLMIDAEQLTNSSEFLSFLGYINTDQKKQKKGGSGSVK